MSEPRLLSLLRLVAVVILCAAFLATPAGAISSLDLVLHYVEGLPAEDQEAYQVRAYISVLDENGNSVKDLEIEDVSVTEDSQTIQVDTLALAGTEPVNIVLVLNTGQRMGAPAIEAMKTAAMSFVSSLDVNDPVALLTYNDEIETALDFTTDHQDVQGEIGRLSAVPGSGACLYDAIYQAIQMTASINSGQRAIVILTNGEDATLAGATCSSMTVEDVINAASDGGMRVPVYTVGLGNQVDEQELERIALLTGGRYHYAEDNDALDPLFLRIATQFDAHYILTYTSYAPAGDHTLAVKVDYSNFQDQDTRDFILPPFPTRVTITSPLEDQEVGGMTTVSAEVSGDGEPVTQLALEINGESVATDDTLPYEFAVDLDTYAEGSLTLTVIATGASGAELARDSLNVIISYAVAAEDDEEGRIEIGTLGILAIIFGVSFLGFLLLIIILVSRSRKNKKKKSGNNAIPQRWTQSQTLEQTPQAPKPAAAVTHATPKPAAVTPAAPASLGDSDATMIDTPPAVLKKAEEGKAASMQILGSLTVEFSDDSSMIGHRFDISRPQTTVGRSADNDINFPKDSPISRRHALIEARVEGLYLSEVQTKDENGELKPPTFGTFINEAPLPAGGAALRNGDIIRLGKRVRLKLETAHNPAQGPSSSSPDLDKTTAS